MVAKAKNKGLSLLPKKKNIQPPRKLKLTDNSLHETTDDSQYSGRTSST